MIVVQEIPISINDEGAERKIFFYNSFPHVKDQRGATPRIEIKFNIVSVFENLRRVFSNI